MAGSAAVLLAPALRKASSVTGNRPWFIDPEGVDGNHHTAFDQLAYVFTFSLGLRARLTARTGERSSCERLGVAVCAADTLSVPLLSSASHVNSCLASSLESLPFQIRYARKAVHKVQLDSSFSD